MLNEIISDNSVEEVDNSKIIEEETSVEKTPSVDEKELKNYLSSSLFEDVRTIASDELEGPGESAVEEIELSEAYASTLKDISEHQLINGRVVGMNDRDVLIDIGFKSEGIIDRSEFSEDSLPAIGDQVEVYLEYLEDSSGNTILSKEKADFMLRWQSLIKAYEEETVITGKIIRRIKGGMIVDLGAVQAFLPGSQLDVRPITDFDVYVDKDIDLRIVKLNEARKNIVVSHKMILEESLVEQRAALFEEIEIGSIMEGRVKNITDFGVFVDLGGIDGLLHITDLSWGRVNHPSEMINLNDDITVKVIEYDAERKRVSLGLKQLTPHPWEEVDIKYPIGVTVKGTIVSLTNYGAFIEIEPGVEGLIHVSEISWTRHIKNPSEEYSMGDKVEAKVISIDSQERKISLGVKQLTPDPWDEIEKEFEVGTKYSGKVQNLTQFGAFIELKEGIDGLVHVSDLSWTKVVRHAKNVLEKGQEVEVIILEVSRENRKIALGMKQLEDDPWQSIVEYFESGKEVSGEIIRILDKGIIIQLDMDVEGIIPFGKMSKKDRRSLASQYEVGANLSGIVMKVSPDDKKIILFKEELAGGGSTQTATDEVKDYLKNQKIETGGKIDIPQELLDNALEAEKEEKPSESE
ncbi:MAG: 30S ribosomal protein S1 [Candidatus Marinimicrobia bacterium]|nr:30S ribosomal protein S1 [Candidatus Neomarinimicrobiota bacterium]